MTRPLCSTGITPLQRYYEAVRPSPAHRYFRPHGWSRLSPCMGLFLSRSFGTPAHLLSFMSFFVRSEKPVSSFSNRRHKRKRFLSCFLVSAPFFCSTAPAGFLPPRP